MSKFFEKYHIKKLIQKGSHGKVFLAETTKDDSTVEVAVKVSIWNKEKEKFPNEIRNNLALLKPGIEGINKMLGYHIDADKGIYWIAMELQPMDLLTYLEKYDPSERLMKYIMYKVISILLDMQIEAGVMHTDLKPENILINPYTLDIYLCDFSDLVSTENNESTIRSGTLCYMSPESVLCRRFNTEKSIVWTIGIMAYVMLNGRDPPYQMYEGQDIKDLFFEECISNNAKSFVLSCLVPDVEKKD